MRRRVLGAAVATVAVGGVALGVLARRYGRAGARLDDDPEWAELRRPVPGRVHSVRSPDGTRLHAEVLGPDRAPTLVLVHGYTLSQHAWHYERRDLRDEFRLVCYDQRGHGRSAEPADGDWSIDALGRDLAAVLDACVPHGQRAVVVGHSMGGMTILSWARQFPDLVTRRLAGAVLLDTTGSDVISGGVLAGGLGLGALEKRLVELGFATLARYPALAQRVLTSPTDLSFLLTRAVALNPDAAPAHVAFTEQLVVECPNRVKAALGPTLLSLDLRGAAPLLAVPTLILVGDRDRLTPVAQARVLAAELPDGRLVELPGVGHMAPLEAHAQVTGHIRAFARRVLRAPAESLAAGGG